MMGLPAGTFRVISLCGSLLLATSLLYHRIKVQCVIVKLQVLEEPSIQMVKDTLVVCLGKLVEIANVCTVSSSLLPSEYPSKASVMTHNLQLIKARSSAPYTSKETIYKLSGTILPNR